MSIRLLLAMLSVIGSLLLITGPVRAGESGVIFLAADSALENTGRNARDKADANLTPDEQKEDKGDIKITAHIRKAVVKDKSLSLNAHNAKIITRNGIVTLRGPVESEAESNKLQQIAKQTHGVTQVDNQLEIKAP
ncbi:MAG: BON domain-containing protein [Methylobacter sp.]|nr:BON domain-containing protein [Methylobacter sp.]